MCSNMQELKQLVAYNRKKRSFHHYEINKVHGECQPMTNSEYKQVPVSGKTTYSKGKSHVYNAYWRGNDEKFDLKQLKKVIK